MYKFIIILLFPIALFSNEPDKALNLGIILGANYVQNETKLPVIMGDTCCGEFNNGNDASFYTGISLNYEFIPSFLFADVRFLFDSRPATLAVNTEKYEVYNSTTDKYELATIQNDIKATLNYFVFDIGAKIRPIESLPFAFRLGFDISDASITKSYTQTRQIIKPSGIQLNGKDIETVSEGDFENLTVSQGLSGSLIADFKLNEIITLSPELSYRYPLNSSMDNIDWFTTLIRAGATFSIRLNEPPKDQNIIEVKESEIEEKIDLVEEQEIIVRKDIIKSLSIDDLTFTETIVTQTYPILPYVFFDSASSNLSNKYYYKGDTKNFSEQKLDKNSLKIYERLLDIIGSRLSESGKGITIKGYTDGLEKETLNDRKSLAISRANTVKEYLVSKWHIESAKINIETEDIPSQPTSSVYKEGLEENRRVELSPNNIDLLKPIIHSQFLEYTTDNNQLIIDIDVDREEIKDYTLIISDDNEQYYSESKLTSPKSKISLDLNNDLLKKLASSDIDNLKVELMITKKDGRLESKIAPFKVIKDNNDFELGRLNLIVFDFDKSVISEPNRNMIDKFIVNNISQRSQIDIVGSTDFLGERLYNKDLSKKRADNVANYINTLLPDIRYNSVSGIGAENPKFDNSSPEGRFYCRTVLIEVKTPIK